MTREEIEDRIIDLIVMSLRNELSEEGLNELEGYRKKERELRAFIDQFRNETYLKNRIERKNQIDTESAWKVFSSASKRPVSKVIVLLKRMAVAAVFGLTICACAYFFLFNPSKPSLSGVPATVKDTILYPPTGNKALLTLANGQQLILDTADNGIIAVQGGSAVSKTGDQLQYDGANGQDQVVMNSITTPRGSNYKLVLADGTKVILNASSKITFPTAFKGKERRVELEGEAWMDVAKSAAQPFIVSVKGVETKVLGTIINIDAYTESSSINTTLIEGSVLVSFDGVKQILRPGQLSTVTKEGKLQVKNADTYAITAWVRDRFSFDNTPLPVVMQALGRWYDFNVTYQEDLSAELVSAVLSRNSKANDLFKDIEASCNVIITVNGHEVLLRKKR